MFKIGIHYIYPSLTFVQFFFIFNSWIKASQWQKSCYGSFRSWSPS